MFDFFSRHLRQVPKTQKKPVKSKPLEVLELAGQRIEIFRRPRKRNIALTMQANGSLKVSAAITTPVESIRKFLLKNVAWIETQSQIYLDLREKYPAKTYTEGESFLFLGRKRLLQYQVGHSTRLKFVLRDNSFFCEIPPALWRSFNPQATHPEVAGLFRKFYEKAGRELLETRVDWFSSRMRLKPSGLSFRSQKTRWGSCSSKGKLSLNWRLAFAPPEVIDYVVVHELAHLKHYDHSQAFWHLVESQIPDYRKWRRWLRTHQYEADFLGRKSDLHI